MSPLQLFEARTLAAAALFVAASASTAFAQCPADDAITTNNDCTNAAGIIGSVGSLSVQGGTEDFWSYTVPSGQRLAVDAYFIASTADIDINIFDDGTCTATAVTGNSIGDNEFVTYTNMTTAPVPVIVRVFIFQNPVGSCIDYGLSTYLTPVPCLIGQDDSEEDNDTCATAVVPSANPLIDMFVRKTDPDYYSISVPAGNVLTVDATFYDPDGNLDLRIFDAGCVNVLDFSNSFSDNESVRASNLGSGAVNMVIEVTHLVTDNASNCNSYDLSWSFMSDPCAAGVDDGEEQNDSCMTAVVPSATALSGLFVSLVDEDFYSFTLAPGEQLDIDLAYINADGDVDAELLASDCITVLDMSLSNFSNFEELMTENTTATPITVILRVFIEVGAFQDETCNNYDMTFTLGPDPCLTAMDDMFEENDECTTAVPIAEGNYPGLFCRKEAVDQDWFSIDVPDMATIVVLLTHVEANGDVDGDLFDACGGTLVDSALTSADVEDMTWTNTTGATVNVKFGVWVWDGDPDQDCNNYDLNVDVSGGGPGNLVPYCFGDGSGTPCPCGNNSTAGHPGGCSNAAGNGAVLVATGSPTVGADTLNFDLSSGTPSSFAVLVSGINQLPQMAGCIGCGLPVFDGLRCAGGGFLRHGSRAINAAGDVGNGWGPPGGPAGGLIAANGFMAGQVRNFFAFYRENVANVCQTGQNSSNGIQVTFN